VFTQVCEVSHQRCGV